MKRNRPLIGLVFSFTAFAAALQAATVQWSVENLDPSGNSVRNGGLFIGAMNFSGSTATVNGVAFAAGSGTAGTFILGDMSLEYSAPTERADLNGDPATSNAALNALLLGGLATYWVTSDDARIEVRLNGLEKSTLYRLQMFFSQGVGSGLWDDFDPDLDTNTWASIVGGSVTNGGAGFIHGKSLWFNGETDRFAQTRSLDLSDGGDISFSFRAGNELVDGDTYWENSDTGENVVLEYTTNGMDFTPIDTLDTTVVTNWTLFSYPIPDLARTGTTAFRWRQIANSGAGYDQWAIDQVFLGEGGAAASSDQYVCNRTNIADRSATFSMPSNGWKTVVARFVADSTTQVFRIAPDYGNSKVDRAVLSGASLFVAPESAVHQISLPYPTNEVISAWKVASSNRVAYALKHSSSYYELYLASLTGTPTNLGYARDGDFEISSNGQWVVYDGGGPTAAKLHSGIASNYFLTSDPTHFRISATSMTIVFGWDDGLGNYSDIHRVPVGGGTVTSLGGGAAYVMNLTGDHLRAIYEDWDTSTYAMKTLYSILLTDTSGSTVTMLHDPLGWQYERIVNYTISPSGSKIVYLVEGYDPTNFTQKQEFYSVDAAGGGRTKLAPNGFYVLSEDYYITPDSTRVVYKYNPDYSVRLYSQPIDGGAIEQIATNADWSEPIFTPDGSRMVYYDSPDGYTYRLRSAYPTGGGKVTLATNVFLVVHAMSPDGTLIVYEDVAGGSERLWKTPIAGGAQTLLAAEQSISGQFKFTPDGTRLIYESESNGIHCISSVPIAGGDATRLASMSSFDTFEITPDSKYVVFRDYSSRDGQNAVFVDLPEDETWADIGVTQAALAGPLATNAGLTYVLTVTNAGPDAVNVRLDDALPAGVDYVSAVSTSGPCIFTNGIVTCLLSNLAAGGRATVSIDTITRQAGVLTNNATTTLSGNDPNIADNTADLTTLVVGEHPDTDGDGIPDDWEAAHGLNPASSNAPNANADGDAMSDWEEYIADTNPTNPASVFPLTVLTNAPVGTMMLVVDPTSAARVYQVLWTTDLLTDPQVWTLYPPEKVGTGAAVTFTVTNDMPGRTYRTGVRLP